MKRLLLSVLVLLISTIVYADNEDSIVYQINHNQDVNMHEWGKVAIMVNSILVNGVNLLDIGQLQPLLDNYIGYEITFTDLQTLAQTLTQAHHQAGYPLVSVIIPPQR